MRLRAPSRGLALSAALLLSLTACNSGSPEDESTASPTTTAPASASGGASSEGSGSESEGSDGAGSGEPAESSDADSTEAGGDGEYVPASEDGPAQNVPKPEMPEAMKEETHAGAKAAVAYWWEAFHYLQQTGDPDPLLMASSDDCQFCHNYAESLEKVYDDGHWHSGSTPRIESTLVTDLNKAKRAVAATSLISFSEGNHFDAGGSIVKDDVRPEATDEPWMNDLRFNPERGRWDVTYVSYEGQPDGE